MGAEHERALAFEEKFKADPAGVIGGGVGEGGGMGQPDVASAQIKVSKVHQWLLLLVLYNVFILSYVLLLYSKHML
jgi:hypothetical protein